MNKDLKDGRELKSDNLPNDVDGIFIELNLRNLKSLFLQHIILILNLRTTILLMLAISLTL